MTKYKIDSGKKVLNMDESGVRIACPKGEFIIVPSGITEVYTPSPENRKSLTIIETIRGDGMKPLPPFVITPGKKIMDNWIDQNLIGNETIDCSPTGYINNQIIMEYCNHLIKYAHAGPDSHRTYFY